MCLLQLLSLCSGVAAWCRAAGCPLTALQYLSPPPPGLYCTHRAAPPALLARPLPAQNPNVEQIMSISYNLISFTSVQLQAAQCWLSGPSVVLCTVLIQCQHCSNGLNEAGAGV